MAKKPSAQELLARMSGKSRSDPNVHDCWSEITAGNIDLQRKRNAERRDQKKVNAAMGNVAQWEDNYKFACGEKFPFDLHPAQGDERNALVALFEATHGHRWRQVHGWAGRKSNPSRLGFEHYDCHIMGWWGVGVEPSKPTQVNPKVLSLVKSLQLNANDLDGQLPEEMCNLRHITTLELASNQLEGPLPADMLSGMRVLEYLDLHDNELSGPLPEEWGVALREVDLSGNKFTGEIPEGIGACQRVTILSLRQNQLEGPIPEGIYSIPGLKRLNLSQNELGGELREDMGLPTTLKLLDISSNFIAGPLPAWISTLTNLDTLHLSLNQMEGPLPEDIGACSKVVSLQAQQNHFTGPIPRSIGHMSNLKYLNLSFNELEGVAPRELCRLSKLQVLLLHRNQLVSPMPTNLRALKGLIDMSIVDTTPSANLSARRRFKRQDFERVHIAAPALDMNTNYSP